MRKIIKTTHAIERQQQRGLCDDVLQFILDFGQVEYGRRCAWHCLQERSLPSYFAGERIVEAAKPWVVITAGRGNIVITAYTTTNPHQRIQRLSRRCRSVGAN